MKRNTVIILVLIALYGFLTTAGHAEDDVRVEKRTYEEKPIDMKKAAETGKVTIHRFHIESNPAKPGSTISLESETNGKLVFQTFVLDDTLACHSWSYQSGDENTRVSAQRENERIFLKGIHKGKEIEKTFKINELPWNQAFNVGLERFATSGEKSMRFWAIGTSGPGDMKITKFAVKKKEIENITLAPDTAKIKKFEAVHIQVSLTGLLSIFWTGNYWYAKDDGCFLRYQGKGGPGSGVMIMELINREK